MLKKEVLEKLRSFLKAMRERFWRTRIFQEGGSIGANAYSGEATYKGRPILSVEQAKAKGQSRVMNDSVYAKMGVLTENGMYDTSAQRDNIQLWATQNTTVKNGSGDGRLLYCVKPNESATTKIYIATGRFLDGLNDEDYDDFMTSYRTLYEFNIPSELAGADVLDLVGNASQNSSPSNVLRLRDNKGNVYTPTCIIPDTDDLSSYLDKGYPCYLMDSQLSGGFDKDFRYRRIYPRRK